MKVKNDFGSRFEGTIGKQMTASTWKGRNYLKKYTKPSNPNTAAQQTVRVYFANAVALWKTLTTAQKDAYADKTRADKTNISAFNTMISNYSRLLNAGESYDEPEEGTMTINDSVTSNPIEGVLITIRKAGQSTDYQVKITDALGENTAAICVEDENYDIILSAAAYITDTKESKTANDTYGVDPIWTLVAIA